MSAFVLTRAAVQKAVPCSLAWFELKARGAAEIVYPDGWTASETARLARENPVALLWLRSKGLIPATKDEVNQAIAAELGPEGLHNLKARIRLGLRSQVATTRHALARVPLVKRKAIP